jgi:hypothetical protein
VLFEGACIEMRFAHITPSLSGRVDMWCLTCALMYVSFWWHADHWCLTCDAIIGIKLQACCGNMLRNRNCNWHSLLGLVF